MVFFVYPSNAWDKKLFERLDVFIILSYNKVCYKHYKK